VRFSASGENWKLEFERSGLHSARCITTARPTRWCCRGAGLSEAMLDEEGKD
jgi:hypothetical protein